MPVAHRKPEAFRYHGRPYLRIEVRYGRDRLVPVTVPGRIAGRYAVRDVLARGGGGVILVAKDLRTNHPVLVKALAEYDLWRYDLSEPTDEILEDLRRVRHHLQTERRILVQLRNSGCHAVPHPNDYVYDVNPGLKGPHRTEFGEPWTLDEESLVTSEPYLVMQHVRGIDLADALRHRARQGLPEDLALHVIDQVARVLEHLQRPLQMPHGQTWHLLYKDLKPGNIIVDRYGRATVLDFGGCQLVIDDTLVLRGSHSPGYCAPECGTSEGAIGPSADCYGLGAVLFHMLSGIPPTRLIHSDDRRDGLRAARIDPGRLAERCAPELVDLVARCVDWDPAARPGNVAEFRRMLHPLLPPVSGKTNPENSDKTDRERCPAQGPAAGGSRRLTSSRHHAYIIDRCRSETPRTRLYEGRKVVFNYRFAKREFYEAADDEWIRVLIRTCCGPPAPDDDEETDTPRQLLRYETAHVLAGQPGWFPEPLDWIEIPSDENPPQDREDTLTGAALVMSRPRGNTLADWRESRPPGSPGALRLAAELLDLVHMLHRRGQIAGGFGPDDILVDETGHPFVLATDRVIPADQAARLRPWFPPDRFPAGFAAPETQQASAPLDARSDLYNWALLCLFLLTDVAPPERGVERNGRAFRFEAAHADRLRAALQDVARRDAEALWSWLPERDRRRPDKLIAAWSTAVERCLGPEPADRLQSVRDVRRLAAGRTFALALGRIWRRLAQPARRAERPFSGGIS